MPRKLLLPFLLLIAALALPAAAQASASNISIMMDDDLMLYRGDQARDDALKKMKSLGVDYVRVTVLWEVVAEDARKGSVRRRRFKGDNPATYPRTNWDKYDRLVKACNTLGIGCYLNVTGPGPSWAHKKPPRLHRALARSWMPKPREYFKFVKAVGLRYSGNYLDENDFRTKLPRVSFWSLYNEPNQQAWLAPQWQRRNGVVFSSAARQYRELYRYGRAALDQTGHAQDIVAIGETAPLGSTRKSAASPTHPKTFIRELFCVNARNAPFTGKSASARRCSELERIGQFRGVWAHHPYTKDLAPTARDKNRNSITIANIPELGGLLDIMADRSKRVARGMSTLMTEFGYESNPPDPRNGIPPAQQAAYINIGDYIAYRDPRVFGNTQFLLRDVEPNRRAPRGGRRYWLTYQSGLFGLDGNPKPAAAAYALPFHVTGKSPNSVGALATNFWGQLRFLPNNMNGQVLIQFKQQGTAAYVTVGDPVTANQFGFFEAQRALPGPGTVRAAWISGDQSAVSREIPVA